MTDTRTFDRLVREWLDLMPIEAPDRVVAAVLQATATTPQVRRSPGVATWRFQAMNRFPTFGVAAAAALVVVVAGVLLIGGVIGTPHPSPSLSPTPASTPAASPAGSPPPAALQHNWAGAGNYPAMLNPGAGLQLTIDATHLFAAQSNQAGQRLITSGATASATSAYDGKLHLVTLVSDTACRAGDLGVYAYSLSTSGRILTLASDQEACPARSAALTGPWYLNGCKVTTEFCLGEMDAGTYQSQYVRPILHGDWAPLYGALTFTVPDGWATDSDWPNSYGLVPVADFRAVPPGSDAFAVRVQLWTAITAESQATPCSGQPDPAIATRASAYAAWLATVKGLVVGPPQALIIGGQHAIAVDIRVDRATAPKCGDPDPLVGIQLSGTEDQGLGGPASGPTRIVLVDMTDGTLVSIWVEVNDPGRFDAFVAAAMPVIETFTFK